MNRRVFLMAAGAAASSCVSSRSRRLNVYNWENYVASSTISDFEREFHCGVRYATYGSAEEMLAKVMSGNSGWDVVFPSNSFVEPMRELRLLLPLDHRLLSNLGNLDTRFQAPNGIRASFGAFRTCTAPRGSSIQSRCCADRLPGPICGPIPISGVQPCSTILPKYLRRL